MKNLTISIRTKIMIAVVAPLIGMIAFACLDVLDQRDTLTEARKTHVREMVQAAVSIVEHYHTMVEKGQLTELAAAAVVGMSVERFRRVFRNVIGVNFRVFRLRIKLEYGRYLLKDESLSVSDVSCELGYATRSKFEVAFKRAFRVTPAKYRLKFPTEKRPLRA